MPSQRGVSGFWLDIKALENHRSLLIAELGKNDGMMAYGIWVRLFTWQYQTCKPIKDAGHVARLTGLQARTAAKFLSNIAECLGQTLVQTSEGFYCKRTMEVLKNYNKNNVLSGAAVAPKIVEDSDSDSDLREEKTKTLSPKPPFSAKKQKAKQAYPDAFEALWITRPKRAGGDDKKRACQAWNARISEGYSQETIRAGVARYHGYCSNTGKLGTEFVKQLATFLGPSDPPYFTQDWEPPPKPPSNGGGGKKTYQDYRNEIDEARRKKRGNGDDRDGSLLEGEYQKLDEDV